MKSSQEIDDQHPNGDTKADEQSKKQTEQVNDNSQVPKADENKPEAVNMEGTEFTEETADFLNWMKNDGADYRKLEMR